MPENAGQGGVFVAVVGPSGAGKDTVLKAAADVLRDRPDIRFARRVITRASDGVSEDHDTLSVADFEALRAAGGFCLDWGAHGLFYGLPAALFTRLEAGDIVVANVSRAALPEAARRFASLCVIEITARPEVLAARIAGRGREDAEAVRRRVARRVDVDACALSGRYLRLDNSDALSKTVDAFVAYLSSVRAVPVTSPASSPA